GGAVAYGHEFDLVPGHQGGQGVDAALAVAARFERVDRAGRQHFSGGVDGRDLDAGAYAGIQPQHRFGAGGRGQQQVFQIGREDAYGFLFRRIAQPAYQFRFEGGQQLDAPGPAADLAQPAAARRRVGREVRAQAKEVGDAAYAGVGRAGFELGF